MIGTKEAARRQFFCDESGVHGGARFLAVGLLDTTVGERGALLERIAAVRDVTGFRNEVHFEKFSPLRERAYRHLLEETLPLVRYRAAVADRSDPAVAALGGGTLGLANRLTEELLRRVVQPDLAAVVYLDATSHREPKRRLADLAAAVNAAKPGSVRAVEALDSKGSELVQLSDFYLGLLRFGYEWGWPLRRGTAAMPAGESRKQRFYRDAAELAETTHRKSRLRVWEWRPAATQ